jgi:hypothetical protein
MIAFLPLQVKLEQRHVADVYVCFTTIQNIASSPFLWKLVTQLIDAILQHDNFTESTASQGPARDRPLQRV